MLDETVMILSGQTAGLGVIRGLGMRGIRSTVIYSDRREMGRKSKYVQQEIYFPEPIEHEEEFIARLMENGVGSPGQVLIPTSDATLAVASRNKEILQEKYRVACPDWETTRIFLDKKYTCTLAEQTGVPAPKTLLPHCVEDLELWGPALQFPCLAKPSQSHLFRAHFSRKMTKVDDMDALLRAYREVEPTGVELMIQEYIPGKDSLGANYNAFFWDGQPLYEFTAHKIRNSPPTTGSPCVVISAEIPEVIEYGRRLLGAIRYSGFACTEFKRDPRDGTYKLMEVNVRHNLSSRLAIHCGMNFPWLEYLHICGEKMPSANYEKGVYWIDIGRDVKSWAGRIGKDDLTLKGFFEPYLRRHVFAILDWKDPLPAVLRTGDIARSIFTDNID